MFLSQWTKRFLNHGSIGSLIKDPRDSSIMNPKGSLNELEPKTLYPFKTY